MLIAATLDPIARGHIADVIGVEVRTAILLRADQVIESASSDLVVEVATQTAVPS